MDFIKNLGELALGSRLRRFSDRIMNDVTDIYEFTGLPFEPRWFPIYCFLADNDKASLAHIARELGITHPSVHQTLAEMTRAKLVVSTKDAKDKRKRLISLSMYGRRLLPQLQPVWDNIRTALRAVILEAEVDVLGTIERLETALDRDRFADRFRRCHKDYQSQQVTIIGYDHRYKPHFEALNRQWIEHYFSIEPSDEKIFANPEKTVIEPGGQIFFAKDVMNGNILGTCALMKREDGRYELAKMAVDPAAQGRQIGRRLGEAVLQYARDHHVDTVMLHTNSKLVPALNLYRKLGFVEVAMEASEYARSNICLVHHLNAPKERQIADRGISQVAAT